ncbi:hypothetical protein HWV62_33095 [Athelia sp. TMB]|nr:hypothetical protein HWV62_33095 [Athelia sp. TMB]
MHSLLRRRSQPLSSSDHGHSGTMMSENGLLDVRAAEQKRPHTSSGPTLLHRVSTLFSTHTSPTKKQRRLDKGLSNKSFKPYKRYEPESRSPSPPSPDIRLPDGLGPRVDDTDEGNKSSLDSPPLPSPASPGFAIARDREASQRGFWAVMDIPPSPAGTDAGLSFPQAQYASQQYLYSPGLLSSFPVPPNKLEFDTHSHIDQAYTNELHFVVPSFGQEYEAALNAYEGAKCDISSPVPQLPLSPALLPLLTPYLPLTLLALVNKSLCLPLARAGLYRVLDFLHLSSDASDALVTVLAGKRELAELVEELYCEQWPLWFLPSSLWSSSFSIAFANMKSLKKLALPKFCPTILDVGQTHFRLTELTLFTTFIGEEDGMDELWEWLAGQVDLQKLSFPKLLDVPTDTFPGTQPPPLPTYFLPSLTTLHAPPSLVHLLMSPSFSPATSPRASSSRHSKAATATSPTSQKSQMSIIRVPLTSLILPISTNLYTPAPYTLRPNALMRAIRGVMELRLVFKEQVDVRSVVRTIGSVGEVLGDRRLKETDTVVESTWDDDDGEPLHDTFDDSVVEDGGLESLDIEVGWGRDGNGDEALVRTISTILPRFCALRTLRLTSSQPRQFNNPKGPTPPSPLCVLPPTPRRHSKLESPLPTPSPAEKRFTTPASPSPLSQSITAAPPVVEAAKLKKKKEKHVPPPIMTQRLVPSVMVHRPSTPSPPPPPSPGTSATVFTPAVPITLPPELKTRTFSRTSSISLLRSGRTSSWGSISGSETDGEDVFFTPMETEFSVEDKLPEIGEKGFRFEMGHQLELYDEAAGDETLEEETKVNRLSPLSTSSGLFASTLLPISKRTSSTLSALSLPSIATTTSSTFGSPSTSPASLVSLPQPQANGHEAETERAQLAAWLKQCPSLQTVVFLSGAEWCFFAGGGAEGNVWVRTMF